jgi:hypothetical protein
VSWIWCAQWRSCQRMAFILCQCASLSLRGYTCVRKLSTCRKSCGHGAKRAAAAGREEPADTAAVTADGGPVSRCSHGVTTVKKCASGVSSSRTYRGFEIS